MENFSRLLGINGTLTLICCIFCIFLPGGKAAWETITRMVGSRVILRCSNESISALNQLTWRMNRDNVFTFSSGGDFDVTQKATNLTLNMSKLQSELYALIIENAQIYHTGNYTCETSTENGVWEQHWTLIIKESTGNWDILMIAAISSVCFLILLIGLVILIRCIKQRTGDGRPSTPAEMQQPTEDIYENCLEIERYNRRHGQPNKTLPIQHRV